ncbi:MAG: (2Fe-2S) ferredoxin domain-containing protein [Eubacterium sp.]
MKSVDELNAIKKQYIDNIEIRTDEKPIKVIVGMGNSGMVSGAREILHKLVELVSDRGLSDRVLVMQEARVSISGKNPVVKIIDEGIDEVTYVNVDTALAERIVDEHLKNGIIIQEHTYNQEV